MLDISYPEEWKMLEDRLSNNENSLSALFENYDNDNKLLNRIQIYTSQENEKSYRRRFLSSDIDLRDLADGKLNSVAIDGATFYECTPGSQYVYRHTPSGTSYAIEYWSKGNTSGLNDPPFTDLTEGIKLKLTDEGKTSPPWPWDGKRWTPATDPQMAGSFTLAPEYLEAEEPIVLKKAMNVSFTIIDNVIYAIQEGKDLSAYSIADGAVKLEKKETLDSRYEMIRNDSSGKMYMSAGIPTADVFEGFEKVMATNVKGDIVMHKSGKWGISFWTSTDTKKVTLKDGILSDEPWVLTNLDKKDDRKGYFKMISDIRISDSHVMVAGKAADDSGEKIMIYDFDGKELFLLEDKADDKYGLGSITGIAETKNGFLAIDGNARQIDLWNPKGAYIGTIEVKKLLGASYCWLEDLCVMADGSIMIAITQDRDDNSADELMFFRLTGF